ncbi:translation initiation factor 2 [Candidatus Agathobaculum pullicola]|uniref:translation initiation factor 2 n=1 Tax=Candidatus Agathobaculum pullicola TaxID=2838426 RepID=UPI003F90D3AE
MADKKNLCAQIDIALHNRVTEEKDRLEMTTSQYIAALLTEYYKMKDENGGINMTGSRTMAFQIPEELFQRIKTHLARETARTGVKLTQRDFVLGLIEQALAEAEASLAPQEAPESTEEASEDNGAAGTTPDASEASTEAERHSGHRTITQGVKARGRRTHLKQMRPPAPFLFFLEGG